jgi:hypothetical protein
MNDVSVIDFARMLDQSVHEMLGLAAAGPDEYAIAGLNQLHCGRRSANLVFILLFPIKFIHAFRLFSNLFDAHSGINGDRRGAHRTDNVRIDVHFLYLGKLRHQL